VTVPLYQAKAELFRTIGHPARIRILELLCERDHAVHELAPHLEIGLNNLSQQLSVLRRSQMVVSTRRDGEVIYSISVPEVRDLLDAGRRTLGQIAASQVDLGEQIAREAAAPLGPATEAARLRRTSASRA
jgi:DNA-binding transcriptional ArsR family regulator